MLEMINEMSKGVRM